MPTDERGIVSKSKLTALATAIKTKAGATGGKTLDELAEVVGGIETGGITPTGTISITENGTVDVTEYASANVNVSGGGITPSGTINITQNGTYDVTNYASAEVAVQSSGGVASGSFTPESTTSAKTINHNLGTYDVLLMIYVDLENYAAITSATATSSHKVVKLIASFGTKNADAARKTFGCTTWKSSAISSSSASINAGSTTVNDSSISLTSNCYFMGGVTYKWIAVKYGENTTDKGDS